MSELAARVPRRRRRAARAGRRHLGARAAAHLRVRRADRAPRDPRARRPARHGGRRAGGRARSVTAYGVPFVARGAGTGLSGGALPVADGVVISLARLNRVLEVDLEHARVVRRARRDEPRDHEARSPPTASSTRPIRRASRSARSAATSPRTRAARTASSTASPSTTCSPPTSSCPTASSSRSRATTPGPTCSARSSAPRARSAIAVRITVRVLRVARVGADAARGVRDRPTPPATRSRT